MDAALSARKASTVKTMKYLVQAIDVQRSKNEELAIFLRERLPGDGKSAVHTPNNWIILVLLLSILPLKNC